MSGEICRQVNGSAPGSPYPPAKKATHSFVRARGLLNPAKAGMNAPSAGTAQQERLRVGAGVDDLSVWAQAVHSSPPVECCACRPTFAGAEKHAAQ